VYEYLWPGYSTQEIQLVFYDYRWCYEYSTLDNLDLCVISILIPNGSCPYQILPVKIELQVTGIVEKEVLNEVFLRYQVSQAIWGRIKNYRGLLEVFAVEESILREETLVGIQVLIDIVNNEDACTEGDISIESIVQAPKVGLILQKGHSTLKCKVLLKGIIF